MKKYTKGSSVITLSVSAADTLTYKLIPDIGQMFISETGNSTFVKMCTTAKRKHVACLLKIISMYLPHDTHRSPFPCQAQASVVQRSTQYLSME